MFNVVPLLNRLLRPKLNSAPHPDQAIIVIGDIHGRADLLDQLIDRLSVDYCGNHTLVFAGDYIDRGEDSAAVLAVVQGLQHTRWPGEVICLKGNHEVMMLDFIDNPERRGAFWLQNGGSYTLASFGIHTPGFTPDALVQARDALCDAMGVQTEAWLRALPLSYLSGNVLVAHAGADPHAPLDRQQETHLIWGHPDFFKAQRRDGVWVAHGHTIVEAPSARDGRISVDTGAYATHRLTAARISDGSCHFLSTEPSGIN